jgi:hypothetical protein
MSNSEDWNDWLTSKLGQEMRTFDDATSSLLESQKRAFSLHCDLLREDEARLGKRSSSSRSVRLRARNVLKNIFQVLGPEVFLLCTLAVPFSKLGDNAPRTRVATLQDWWNGIQPPQGLVTIAKEECDENAIETLLSSAPKDLFSESVVLGEQYSVSLPTTSDDQILDQTNRYLVFSLHQAQKTLQRQLAVRSRFFLKKDRAGLQQYQSSQFIQTPLLCNMQ